MIHILRNVCFSHSWNITYIFIDSFCLSHHLYSTGNTDITIYLISIFFSMLNNPEGNLDQPHVDPLWAVNGKYSVCKYNFRLLTSPLILSSDGAAEEQNNVLCSAYVGHSSRTHLAVTFFLFFTDSMVSFICTSHCASGPVQADNCSLLITLKVQILESPISYFW